MENTSEIKDPRLVHAGEDFWTHSCCARPMPDSCDRQRTPRLVEL